VAEVKLNKGKERAPATRWANTQTLKQRKRRITDHTSKRGPNARLLTAKRLHWKLKSRAKKINASNRSTTTPETEYNDDELKLSILGSVTSDERLDSAGKVCCKVPI
jgi:BRCT domain type II-containing protein